VVGLTVAERQDKHLVLNAYGKPHASAPSFSSLFATMTNDLKIEDRTFHDLRRTAVTKMFISGCSEAEIATITGHSHKTVHQILDKHYFHRDLELAENALLKRAEYEANHVARREAGEIPNRAPNRPQGVLVL
jgi:integrase